MTETTTKEHVDNENLVDAAARAATEAAGKTLATLEPEQTRFTEHQVAILRQIGLEDATQGDLDLFFHVCRTTGLDPFRKQIYMIGRNTKLVEWVDNASGEGRRKVEKYVTKYTIQTGIDGFRRNGREAAKALGDSLAFDGPYWCGEDGEWREVWPAGTPPVAAKYTVFRNGEPFSAVVHYDEFVQTNAVYEGSGQSRRKVSDEPNSMWAKMPRNQTAKCAEAMAYRRAFPDDLSGLILEDSAQSTVIDQDGNVESAPKQRPADRTGGLRARARAAADDPQEPMDVETVDVETTDSAQQEARAGDGDTSEVETKVESTTADPGTGEPKKPMRKALEKRLFALIGDIDPALSRDDRIDVYRGILRAPGVTSTNDLDDVAVAKVCDQLYQWGQDGQLDEQVRNILMAADAIASEAAKVEGAQAE